MKYRTTSRYGYCLNDRKPPKIDSEAEYRIVGDSIWWEGRPIIERCDGQEYEGESRWIVDSFTLRRVEDER